jgi:aminoglycoside phosphotransferase (APT) family kinase protein
MNKAEVTPDLVARLVVEQFPQWADLPVRRVAEDGHDHSTFHLGDAMSVRLPSGEFYSPQVEKEQRWLPTLAPQLPLPVPEPLAKGAPTAEFRHPWSIYRWLEGHKASAERIADLEEFARQLASFLSALYAIDPTGGPRSGLHNFFRGGEVTTYEGETLDAIAVLAAQDAIDAAGALAVWRATREARWTGDPVWVHGDMAAGNLLVNDEGQLSAVIDFGCAAIGDPACDLTIAWTAFEGASREAFRDGLDLDEGTWARARGWALWKAAIMLARFPEGPRRQMLHQRVIADVIAEQQALG